MYHLTPLGIIEDSIASPVVSTAPDMLVRYERGVPKDNPIMPDVAAGSYVIINRRTGTVGAFNPDGSIVWPERKLAPYEETTNLEIGMWYVGTPVDMRLPEGF
jgi:hypothetical protein